MDTILWNASFSFFVFEFSGFFYRRLFRSRRISTKFDVNVGQIQYNEVSRREKT